MCLNPEACEFNGNCEATRTSIRQSSVCVCVRMYLEQVSCWLLGEAKVGKSQFTLRHHPGLEGDR